MQRSVDECHTEVEGLGWERFGEVEDPKASVAERYFIMGKVEGAEATGPCRAGQGNMPGLHSACSEKPE